MNWANYACRFLPSVYEVLIFSALQSASFMRFSIAIYDVTFGRLVNPAVIIERKSAPSCLSFMTLAQMCVVIVR